MKIAIFVALISVVAAVKCTDFSLLRDLNSLDFLQIFHYAKNISDLEDISQSRKTGNVLYVRDYDQGKCVIDLGAIADGLSRTEMWALKLVDSWGKIPSGILEGNVHEQGSFSECMNLERNAQKYASQYCLAKITVKIPGLLQSKQADHEPEMETRNAIPMPSADGLTFSYGICIPQSCSPIALTDLLNLVIPKQVQDKMSVKIDEEWCQVEEYPSDIRLIDWIAIGLFTSVFSLMIASTWYDIHCNMYEKPKRRLFMIFSVYTNGRSLLSAKKSKSKDVMDCVHGIRVFSTQWVVLGHSYIMYIAMPTTNAFSFMGNLMTQYHSMYLLSAFISVDTFFMLSGLFASYTMLKHLEKTKGRINIPLLYFHRLLRLTPLLAVGVLLTVSVIRFAGSGPQWPMLIKSFNDVCEENWWKTLLYIQNYVTPEKMCFGHSWYLAVDMQLFLISPFIVYGIYRFRVKFLYLLTIFIGLCVGCTISTFIQLNYTTMLPSENGFVETYFSTHLRYSPWLIGIIFGSILHESRKRSVRIPRKVNLVAWFFTLAMMATVIFANYPLWQPENHSTALENSLYTSLSRVGWAVALSYVIYACVHGYGGPVNWFLSLSIWQPLSRLSYAIYILHFPVTIVVAGSAKTPFEASELFAYHAFLGYYVLSILVSIVGSLAFESPIILIEKLIFGSGKKSEPRNNTTPTPEAPNEIA